MIQTMKVTVPRIFLLCFFSLFTLAVWAQENNEAGGGETKSTTTTTTKTTDINVTANDTWYTQPWVWIVGAAVFILLLVALLSGGKRRDTSSTTDRVVVKKTVERDAGTDI
ncbi:MAG: hypothetical protein JWR72_2430 [Flavisolibacter sp.]|jgi:hypothetical protein|nr:hypothetical protein [Flavisolibacter sp.]